MKIETSQFGKVEFERELIIKFSSGLFGFEKLKDFILIKMEDEIFYWLYSVEQPQIGFPLIGLRVIDEKFPETESHEAFGIVTLNSNPMKITVNLKAPVYINQNEKTGIQKILEEENYPVNYNLFIEEEV